jgi:hypothetical protein
LEETVRGADGQRYQVRLARTGIHRRVWGAPVNHILNDISWIRVLRSKEKTWTLTLVHRGDWGDKTIWEETFPNREDAAVRAEWLIDVLLNNAEYGEGLRKAGN